MRQFSDVNGKYGAPMGRREFGTPEGKAQLFRVKMVDGDYDDGGAYWGGRPSEPLYCLRSLESEHFFRARSRREAAGKAREQFPDLKLLRPEVA